MSDTVNKEIRAKRRRDSSAVVTALPNLLTYGRIAAVPALAAFLFTDSDQARWIALAIYVVACITDFFDGYLARRRAESSKLGQFLDPIADKLLISVVLLMLVFDHTIEGPNVWAAIIILCREVLVSGLREFLAELRVSVPVTQMAKWKTTIQMIAIGFLIAGPAGDKVLPFNSEIGVAGLWIAAVLTLYTGYDYFRAGMSHIVED